MPRDARGGLSIVTLGDLIDTGGGIHVWCASLPVCGRQLDCDVYDLVIWLGRRQRFVRTRLPLRCARCGSTRTTITLSTETRGLDVAAKEMPENFKRSRTAEERQALAAVFPRRS